MIQHGSSKKSDKKINPFMLSILMLPQSPLRETLRGLKIFIQKVN
jgi:hypothetical protein